MILDKYTKVSLSVIAGALTLIAVSPLIPSHDWLHSIVPQDAEAQKSGCPGISKNKIPRSFKLTSVVSGLGGTLFLFESPDAIWVADARDLLNFEPDNCQWNKIKRE